MRRVVSLHLATWPTDRLRRTASAGPRRGETSAVPPPGEPLVTAARLGSRRVIAAVDARARELGLHPGMTIAHAGALVPGLHVVEAQPEADAAALTRLAAWCTRYAPLVAPDPPDGIWIDVTGAAHLFGGEAGLLDDLVLRLAGAGVAGRAAIADTPGAAWALARYGGVTIAPPGEVLPVLADLPVAALRLDGGTVEALRRVGIERIREVAGLPGAPLSRRFGLEVRRRLDQATGLAHEPIRPLVLPETPQRRLAFAEPISAPESLARVAARLCAELCRDLEAAGVGARRLDLLLSRVDRTPQAVRVATARPTRSLSHLARLLTDKLGTIDPGFGIEDATLVAIRVEPLPPGQVEARGIDPEDPSPDLGPLVDVLAARLGAGRLYRQAPVESEFPERSVARIPALAEAAGLTWPAGPRRPARLFEPPEPIDALALLPDAPPAAFVWRALRRRVVRADGPERLFGEWWRGSGERTTVRDYYRVEDADGRRYWLFRDAPADEGGRWFVHGLFG